MIVLNQSNIYKAQSGLRLWQARHCEVLKLIEKEKVEVLIDFGTNESLFLQKVQRGLQVKHMIGIDIDPNIIPIAIDNLQPEPRQYDLMFERPYDQKVQLKTGSVLQRYNQLRQMRIDLISLIEVIQHIQEKFLQLLNENVFGFIQPRLVFISTPNSQFNPIFNWEEGRKFRHDDHKFQWTRSQFKEYVDSVCQKYPYKATISGVGESVSQQHRDKGFCSQYAIFQRIDLHSRFNQNLCNFQKDQQVSKKLETINELAFPLTQVYSHTNYSWITKKDDLISLALKQITLRLNLDFIPWSKLFQEFKKKLIFKKLAELDDRWQYEYFIKDEICNLFQNPQEQFIFDKDGYKKIIQICDTPSHEEAFYDQKMEQQMLQFNTTKYNNNDDDSLFRQRQPRNKRIQNNSESEISDQSSSSQNSSSSSSINSWQSVEIPDEEPKRIMNKRKKRYFKSRKANSNKDSTNQN